MATDALELGIDIGELDAAICVTFPGTVASLRQMWGRAGRRGRGLAVYIAGEDALDQFFCRHPDEFLGRAVEAAILDPHSPEIFAEHLLCAAHEAPLTDEDADILGARVALLRDELTEAGFLRERATGFVPAPRRRLPGGANRAAVGLGRQLRADRRELGRAVRDGRARPRLRDGPRGRRVPAHGALLPRARTRPGRPAGAARAVRWRLLHAGQARNHDLHHPRSRPARHRAA